LFHFSETTSSAISNSSYKQVVNLLKLVQTSSSQSPEAAALFMDELSAVISKGALDTKVEVETQCVDFLI
jgi:hypothetical protein